MFDYSVNLYESALMVLFAYLCCIDNLKNGKHTLPCVLCTAMLFGFITVCNYYSPTEGFLTVMDILILFIFLRTISELDSGHSLLVSITDVVILNVVNMLYTVTLGNVFFGITDYYMMMEQHRYIVTVVAQIIHTLIYLSSFELVRRNIQSLYMNDCLLISVMLVLTEFISVCFQAETFVTEKNGVYMTVGVYCTALLIILMIFFFRTIHERTAENEKIKLELELLNTQQRASENIIRVQKEAYEMRHDIRHYIESLREEVKMLNHPEVEAKLKEYEDKLNKTVVPVFTIIPAVNAVLNTKREEALQKGIDFVCRLNITHDPQIEDSDIYLLLGNALDNAISHIGLEKKIEVEMREVGNMFKMQVSNSVNQKMLDEKGDFYPFLMNEGHGYGIRTMERVAQKYDGFITYSEANGMLTLTILIMG